jgi:DNA-binding transcriptional MerR regulator
MKNNLENFFTNPTNSLQRKYEALRAFYTGDQDAKVVAENYGYTLHSFYSLTKEFAKLCNNSSAENYFFAIHLAGRKPKVIGNDVRSLIITLRKKYLSVPDIKAILDSQDHHLSEQYIYQVIHKDGFIRLPRRDRQDKQTAIHETKIIQAAKTERLVIKSEEFNVADAIGVLCLIPYIQDLEIDQLIVAAGYPATKVLPTLNSVLSFIALKLVNVRRYTADDLWCMNRGLGLFAGLNVLPKAGWFTSYSHRVTRAMNMRLLQSLSKVWMERDWLGDTANLDFATIPYWGDDTNLENNWSGTRHKALASILAVLAQDPATGIITYGDTTVRHDNKSAIAIEFLDFYKQTGGSNLKYLVFDSKFTTYENLRKLDDQGTKFITIRRRGKEIVGSIGKIPSQNWVTTRITSANGKTREIKVADTNIFLKGYNKQIRQLAITGHGKIKPALIITNDFDLTREVILKKYAQRWLVEKEISEQIYFFHLNNVFSSMVIKVDFDLTMTILAHNLLRLLAADLEGYTHNTAVTLYEKFLYNSGTITVGNDVITVNLKKKRHLPLLLTAMERWQNIPVPWLQNRKLRFQGATTS